MMKLRVEIIAIDHSLGISDETKCLRKSKNTF